MKKLLLTGIILFVSCATFMPPRPEEPEAKLTSEEVAIIYERGNAYYKTKEYEKAISVLKEIIEKHSETAAYEPALNIMINSYYKLNKFKKAAQIGEKFLKAFPNSDFLLNVTSLVGESYFKLDENYKAAYYLMKFYTQTEDSTSRKMAFKHIIETIPDLSIPELEKLHRLFMSDALDEHILYCLAQLEARQGKKKEAQRDFNLLLRRFPNTKYSLEAQEYKRYIDIGEATGRAGILLPLSGEYSKYGQKFLEIVEVFRRKINLPFSLHSLDTKSDPIEAIIAASKLITDIHVDFIIAPIRLIEAFGVCGLSSGKGIPVILPMTSELRLETIPLIFTAGHSSEEQARVIAQYSMYDLGINSFSILFPDVARYRSVAEVFAAEVRKNNREVVAMVGFDPDSITLKWKLEAIKKSMPDAIFLPMDKEMLINTAPQVAYYGLEDIKILGIDTFKDEKVPRLGEKYVEGAIFAAASSIDNLALSELRKEGFKPDDFTAKFFYTLWRLKGLTTYNRNSLPRLMSQMLKSEEVFNVYEIKNGEFVKIAEMSK